LKEGGRATADYRHCREGCLNTTYFGSLIGERFTGGSEGTAIMERGRAMDPTMLFAPPRFRVDQCE
jgi:hypothetical protein